MRVHNALLSDVVGVRDGSMQIDSDSLRFCPF